MRNIVAEHAEETGVSIVALCRAVGLARATFYRISKPQAQPEETETALRDALQQVALEFPCYGYRRITAQLSRDGWQVNQVTQA